MQNVQQRIAGLEEWCVALYVLSIAFFCIGIVCLAGGVGDTWKWPAPWSVVSFVGCMWLARSFGNLRWNKLRDIELLRAQDE